MKTIKTNKVVLAILTTLISNGVYSQKFKTPQDTKSNASNYLELNCKLEKGYMKTSDTYTVSFIRENTEVKSIVVKAGKSFKFLMKENSWYAIKIKNEESTTKLISINTTIPMGNIYSMCHYKLFCEIGKPLSNTEAQTLDADVVDFPAAVISYDAKKEAFYLNEEYYTNIRKSFVESLVENETKKN